MSIIQLCVCENITITYNNTQQSTDSILYADANHTCLQKWTVNSCLQPNFVKLPETAAELLTYLMFSQFCYTTMQLQLH